MSGTVDVRRRAILDRLEAHGRVEVGALSAVLGVTEETIRRDLRALELEGLLRRAHGGAVRSDLDTDRHPDLRAAAALADRALTLIDAGSAVFLGGGSACEALAARLAPTPGTVLVTGSVPVALAAALADERAVVHLIGGTADDHGLLTGAWAREQLGGLRLDVAVVEALGVTADGRLLHASPEEAAVVATAAGLAGSAILLVDPETFGAGGLAASVPATSLATALLAGDADPGALEALLATGVRVETIGVGA
jgi:DeoR family fructose operon transcriptional repressor